MSDSINWKLIQKARKARDLTVKDLAEKIGLHPNTLSSALNGNRALGKSALKLLFRELKLDEKALSQRAS